MVNHSPGPDVQSISKAQSVILRPGLSIWSGLVDTEYLPDLKPWSRAFRVYTEMAHDPIIATLLDAITTPLLGAEFSIVPASSSQRDKAIASFVWECLHSMQNMTWREHVEEMLSFLVYGFAIAEKVLDKRPDGRIVLRALIPIGQETLLRWGEVDELGRVKSFVQMGKDGKVREAPMDKLLHFTLKPRLRDPQGQSLLRSLYRPWYFKKNLEVIEAIGIERDVGNAPIAELGEGYASEEFIQSIKKALEGFRMDEALYLIVPHGTRIYAYGGGNKVYNIREVIRDLGHTIRQRFFADFIALGSEGVGTQALARESTTFFSEALRSIQTRMLEVWNSQLIPYLLRFNGIGPPYPKLVWYPPGRENTQSLAQAYQTLVQAGVLTPDPQIERAIRARLGLP